MRSIYREIQSVNRVKVLAREGLLPHCASLCVCLCVCLCAKDCEGLCQDLTPTLLPRLGYKQQSRTERNQWFKGVIYERGVAQRISQHTGCVRVYSVYTCTCVVVHNGQACVALLYTTCTEHVYTNR